MTSSPIVSITDAGQVLLEGDAELTPEGRRFVDSDIAERKEIFAKAALERVALVRQIRRRVGVQVQSHVA